MKRPSVVATMLLALAIALPSVASAGDRNDLIFPPNSHPAGASYETWAARFARYLTQRPPERSPLVFPTCRNIGENHGVLIFPVAVAEGIVDRCDIPAHTPILFSPGGTFHIVGLDAPNRRGVKRLVRQDIARTHDVKVWIDGDRVPAIDRFYVEKWTEIELRRNNLFGAPPGEYDLLIAGWALIVRGFPEGHHTIKLHDVFPDSNGNEAPASITFFLDVDDD